MRPMNRAVSHLYTLGYEGMEVRQFISTLERAGIRLVVDVRELPLSRKAGFSKRALSDRLRRANIDYLHVPSLGCPKDIRQRYRKDGDWQRYCRGFSAYLSTRAADIRELAKAAREQKSCLICFEADFRYCHRTHVARAAVLAGAPKVLHLTATATIADQSLPAAA